MLTNIKKTAFRIELRLNFKNFISIS